MTLFLTGTVGDQPLLWPLDQDTLRIGRSSRNPIQISDPTVSKEHAEITRRGERVFVRDLGSRNGTRVNGVEAKEALPLKLGDHLEVGHVLLEISDGPARVPVKYNDATVLGSSLRLRADQILERRTKSTAPGGPILHLLAEAGRLLVLPRPLRETCDELLSFVEKAVRASRYVVLLRGEDGSEPTQIAARMHGGRSNQPLALSRSIMRMVMEDCTSVLTADASLDPRFQGQQSIVAQAVHSAMAVPLFDNEKVLGVLYVDSQDFSIAFSEQDLELLTLLANMAAVKITNARLLEAETARERLANELATATRIQQGLLPSRPPKLAGYSIDAFLESCYEVGGDLYDFHVAADGRLMFLVGDVSGKGMGAALLMSSFLASARVLYDTCRDPSELAIRLGNIIHRGTDSRHFITAVVGCLEPETGALQYVNAGHPPACIVLGDALRELPGTGVPFGVLPSFPYTSASAVLEPGATLAVFSDGIPEAQRGDEFFDEARVHEALKVECRAGDLSAARGRIVQRIDDFLDGEHRTDDLTLVLLRREPASA
jgi:serine phosphatase RsbU (regulator of sigma subunit)